MRRKLRPCFVFITSLVVLILAARGTLIFFGTTNLTKPIHTQPTNPILSISYPMGRRMLENVTT